MPKIKDLPRVDLPREKLQKYGVKKLKDYELLAILLGSGIEGLNVLRLSKKILRAIVKIGKDKIVYNDLLSIKGLGEAKASQILATLELSKRLNSDVPEVLSAEDVWKYCADIRNSKKEHFVAFYLDTHNRLIDRQIISVGTLDASLVHPREVFEPAVSLRAVSVIIAHNHPSDDTEPSKEDILITQKLNSGGKILGITLLDHIIIGNSSFLSLKGKGFLN